MSALMGRKGVAWVLSLLGVVLLVVGCGSQDRAPQASPVAAGYGPQEPPVTIEFWYMPNGPSPDKVIRGEVDRFHALHPNITVRATKVDWPDALTRLTTAAASGSGPDVSQLGTTRVRSRLPRLHRPDPQRKAVPGRGAWRRAVRDHATLSGRRGRTRVITLDHGRGAGRPAAAARARMRTTAPEHDRGGADMNVRLISDEAAELGEGPRLDARTGEVLWVDITAGRLYRCRWDAGRLQTIAVIEVGRHLGAVAPVEAPGGGWVAAAGQGFAHVAEDGTVTVLAEPEAGRDGRTRMNDGACDPQGRFWAGSMAYDETPGAGTLYRMDHDGTVTPVVTGVTISNGLGWSPDGTTMYYADTGVGTLDAFDFDGVGGELERRRTLVRCEGPGFPDGLWVDDEGCLWVAMWGGGEVRRYAPDGGLIRAWPLPVSQPSACCFAGRDGDTLIITSARSGLSGEALAREPAAGRLLAIDAGATGPAATPYRPRSGVLPEPPA